MKYKTLTTSIPLQVGRQIRKDFYHHKRRVNCLLFLCIFTQLILSQEAYSQETPEKSWSYTVGTGMVVTPSYLGDDDHQVLLFPNFTATYGEKFSASLFEGVRYNILKKHTWTLGAVLRYNVGRYEDGTVPSRLAGDKTEDLIGLGDINFTLEPGLFISYTDKALTTTLELRKGIGGHKGFIGKISSQYQHTFRLLGKPMLFTAGPELAMTGTNFNNAFFGINETQSSETGLDIYKPGFSALTYGLGGSILIPTGKRISTLIFASYNRLSDTIANSDLIRQHGTVNQTAYGLIINYSL